MSKKRPTESSWDSDEELLNDTSGNAITAFPKTSELDLLGDDGELDEDALLGVDETGAKTTTISFANDSLWPMTNRQRSKSAISHQVSHDEQAFVFEETDTADLEDELNVGVQEEDGSVYHVGRSNDYTTNIYRHGGGGNASDAMPANVDRRVDYTSSRRNTADSGDMGYLCPQTGQAPYGDESSADFGDASASGDYIGDAVHENHEDASGVELEYEQPVEQEEQVHLEYEDSHTVDQQGNLQMQEPKNPNYESESDSDDGDSRHSRGKFTSERTGVISLAPATARETIPDTLEINEEQAAQIEQFMSDKPQGKKGRGRGQGRPSAHSRLGQRSNKGPHQNPKGPQGSRMAPFPRGMLGQNLQMGFPFAGPPNRGPFPVGLLSPRGPFPMRLLNQRGLFSGPQNQRQSFPMGPGAHRGSFSLGPLNMLLGSGPQRGLFHQERFQGAPNQRGPFAGGPQSLGPHRSAQQNSRNQQGPHRMRGPPLNQSRPQGSFNQRAGNPAQFGPRPPLMGQQGARPPGPRNSGPRNAGPRPLMAQAESGVRFARPIRPPAVTPSGQPIPSLVKPATNLGKSPQGNEQPRPGQINPLIPPDSRRVSPHQRLGPVQGQTRFQNPTGPPQGPRFMSRNPVSGGPFMNPPAFQGNQPPQISGQGDFQAVRKHKIYINPRFQNQQAPAGTPGIGRTVKMGVPIQQKKAKNLLERAIQTQNKQASPVPVAQVGVKRKSTGEESVPTKVMKPEEPPVEKPEVSSTRVVQTSTEQTVEESQKMKVLLEEQKRQRELIKKKKELARQKQAAVKRKELETRLKEEGKTIGDILGTTKTEVAVESKQVVPAAKPMSGSVAARLGPPPSQQQAREPQQQQQARGSQQQSQHLGPTSAKMRPPVSQGTFTPAKSQQFSGAPQQSQNFQARTPVQAPTNQPSMTVPPPSNRVTGPPPSNDTRFRGPAQDINLRWQAPPPTNDPRFQSPPATNQFRATQPSFDKRFRAPQSSQNHSFRGPPPSTDHRLRAPPPNTDHSISGTPPMTDQRLRGPSLAATVHSSSVLSQSIRYSAPPPTTGLQTVRFPAPHSAPPQVPVQMPVSQHFQPQYNPTSAPPSLPLSHYPQPSQSDTAVYPSLPQYTPQATSYQLPAYSLPAEHQYQSHVQHPPSQPFIQSTASQYQLPPQQQYQTPEASQYQVPPPQHQYQNPPPQSHYQPPPTQPPYLAPPVQPQYQNPPPQPQYQTASTQPQYRTASTQPQYRTASTQSQYQTASTQPQYQTASTQSQYQTASTQSQYQTASTQPQYQTASTQSQYQTASTHQYQKSAQSYSTPPDLYQQATISYYNDSQPIQTVTSPVTPTPSAAVGDQRTVQHHTPVGQRIQTIGQRVQPVSAAHMRSIIQNVVSQPNHAEKGPSARLVQSQPAASRVTTDGQVRVLDGPQKILIQNVPAMATKETLIKICRHFGQVLGVNLMSEQNKAVVQFQKGEQAAKCVAKCDQKCLHKTRLTVKLLPS